MVLEPSKVLITCLEEVTSVSFDASDNIVQQSRLGECVSADRLIIQGNLRVIVEGINLASASEADVFSDMWPCTFGGAAIT